MDKHKLKVQQAFAQAACHYDDFAHLQRTVAISLLEKATPSALQGRVLDIGCGTGFLTQLLKEIGVIEQLIALDIALPMLQQAQQRLAAPVSYICGDAEALPLGSASVDVIFSSLALQWCQNLSVALHGFRQVLKPGGKLCFATFGAATLSELKQAWAAVDQYRHINDFYTVQQLHDSLRPGEWQNIQVTQQVFESRYASVTALLRELKGLGAQSVNSGRKPQLTTPAQMQQMFAAYPKVDETGHIVASFEVIWVVAEVKA